MNKLLMYFLNYCQANQIGPDELAQELEETPAVKDAYFDALDHLYKGMMPTIAGNVYTLPILEGFQADNLVREAKNYSFAANDQEEREYQIEEAVLEHVDPSMFNILKRKLLPTLNAWCLMINATPIVRVSSFQVAKYRPDGVAATGWHHDEDSDFTCVISLSPDDFEGGGTGVRTSPHDWLVLPPLKKGWGMVFNGRTVQHRGLPVTKGERLLLVCWCSTEDLK